MNKTSNVPAAARGDRYLSPFSDLFGSFFAPAYGGSTTATSPSLDVVENDEGFKLSLDLPGMSQDQVNVQFADNVLTVQGERQEETARDEDRWHIVERTRGSFARSVKFPTYVDAGKVKATMKNGVLTVFVPKSEGAKTQKIKVDEA